MADKLPFNGPVELNGATTIAGALTTSGTGTHSGTNTFNGETHHKKIRGGYKEVLRQTVFTSTKSLSAAESGAIVLLDKDEATTITLPAVTAADIGINYTFIETVVSNNLRKIVTKYDNDYLVGGVTNSFDGASTDSQGTVAFVSAGGTDTTITLGDDDLANAGGGLGATVTVTAILTGNTGAGGGSKLVWAVVGSKIAQAETDTGAAFFS